jgi:hypothetical protein
MPADFRLPIKTPQAAARVGVRPKTLIAMIRLRRIHRPAKDSTGHFIWSEQDIAAALRARGIDRRKRGYREAAYV